MSAPTISQGMWCHIEIPSTDPERTKSFFGDVFGWTFQDVPLGSDGTYTLYMTGEGGIGGGIWNPPEGMPRQMVNYIWVEDLAPIRKKAEKAGGKVLLEEQEVPGTGWFSLIADPDGNVFGAWKQNPEATH